jgi:hypothetical protein
MSIAKKIAHKADAVKGGAKMIVGRGAAAATPGHTCPRARGGCRARLVLDHSLR